MSKTAPKTKRMIPEDVVYRISRFKTFDEAMARAVEMKQNAGNGWTPACTIEVVMFAGKFKGGNSHQRKVRMRVARRILG